MSGARGGGYDVELIVCGIALLFVSLALGLALTLHLCLPGLDGAGRGVRWGGVGGALQAAVAGEMACGAGAWNACRFGLVSARGGECASWMMVRGQKPATLANHLGQYATRVYP